MTHILKTLGLAVVILACGSTAAADEGDKEVAFKYTASDTAEDIYKRLKVQARRHCGDIDYPKAKRKCANELIEQVLVKVGSSRLYALHESKTGGSKTTRKYAVRSVEPSFVSIP